MAERQVYSSGGALDDPSMQDEVIGIPGKWGRMFNGEPFFTPGRDIDLYRAGGRRWEPECKIREVDEGMLIEAALPGVKREDVFLRVEEDGLILRGERRQEKSDEGEGYWHRERQYGKFCTRIALPRHVDTEKIKASFHQGLLQILVPVPEEHRRRHHIGLGEQEYEEVPQHKKDSYREFGTAPASEEGGPTHEEGTKEETRPLLSDKHKERLYDTSREASTTMSTNV